MCIYNVYIYTYIHIYTSIFSYIYLYAYIYVKLLPTHIYIYTHMYVIYLPMCRVWIDAFGIKEISSLDTRAYIYLHTCIYISFTLRMMYALLIRKKDCVISAAHVRSLSLCHTHNGFLESCVCVAEGDVAEGRARVHARLIFSFASKHIWASAASRVQLSCIYIWGGYD